MACSVFAGFQNMTEHLNPEIYSRLRLTDYWLDLVDRAAFPENTGTEQTVTTLNNTEPPTVTPTWGAINLTSVANPSGPCNITYSDVTWGYNTRIYEPEQYGLEGPPLCKDEFTFDWMTDEFINHYVDQLTYVTRRVWSNRLQEHFISLTPKIICNGSTTSYAGATLPPGTAQATLPNVQATSQLTQDYLDSQAYALTYAGASATQPDAKGYITLGPDGPVFPLLISMEMSKQLALQAGASQYGALLSAGTAQLESSQLMKKIGATKVLFNFRHIICTLPARYNWNGSAYVRVEPFMVTSGPTSGLGNDAPVNPLWLTAAYEAAMILHPLVMRTEIIQPEVNAGGLPFDATNYYGDWQFETGGERIFPPGTNCFDPLHKFGRHFAEFKHAVRPIHPYYGRTFIYKRCISSPFSVGCS